MGRARGRNVINFNAVLGGMRGAPLYLRPPAPTPLTAPERRLRLRIPAVGGGEQFVLTMQASASPAAGDLVVEFSAFAGPESHGKQSFQALAWLREMQDAVGIYSVRMNSPFINCVLTVDEVKRACEFLSEHIAYAEEMLAVAA